MLCLIFLIFINCCQLMNLSFYLLSQYVNELLILHLESELNDVL